MKIYNKIKGFSNYEISEDKKTIKTIKTGKETPIDSGKSVRLYNDAKERVTVSKEDFFKLIIISSKKTETKKPEVKKSSTSKKEVEVKPKKEGKIFQILKLYKEGKKAEDIVELGFDKSTVRIQIAKYLKSLK